MPHPLQVNHTPFEPGLIFASDVDANPLGVALLQATYFIAPEGRLEELDPQPPIELGGTWWGEPGVSSVRLEPQVAWTKPSTDVVLLGHVVAPRPDTTEMMAGIRIGTLRKLVRVTGDRWLSGRGGISPARPFDRVALTWENAFGGWDRRHPDPSKHTFESRNPIGRGFRDPAMPPDEDVALPNIEDPERALRQYGDRPPPAGFGFVGGDWQPRAKFAGTYDEAWARTRQPLLPLDFDPRWFNAGPAGLVSARPLAGDEDVVLANVSGVERLAFALPGLGAPTCTVALRGGRTLVLDMVFDTLVVDADARTVALTWRACFGTRNGPHDVVALEHRFPGTMYRRGWPR